MAKCPKCERQGAPVPVRFTALGAHYIQFQCSGCQSVLGVAPDAVILAETIKRELQRR